ncbi:hypothetical protein HWV62_21058 [Athelia sp. TMB]|nr:hypothetical protein HWV62_21058 [Athelia sp. TMB]
MKYLLSFIALSASANAYADIGTFVKAQRLARSLENRAAVMPFPPIGGVPWANSSVPFDTATQLVSVSGNHVYEYEADGKTLDYTYGYERIPNNWYKHSPADPWTIVDILTAGAQQCLAYPNTCKVGGNTGNVSSFAGINVGDLTGAVILEALKAHTLVELNVLHFDSFSTGSWGGISRHYKQ